MSKRLLIGPIWLALGVALACAIPTDRSGDLRVDLASLPDLLLKDSVQLEARVLDAAGELVPGAALDFASSDPTVLAVSEDGVLRAVGVGAATLTVTAVSFASATPFTQSVRVRGTLEVDSVLPRTVRFGDSLSVFGVGLDPDSLFQISLGGAEATVAEFLPRDPARPRGEAELRVWVPPPAERLSTLTLLGFAGGVLHPDTVQVAQRDLYEPNDTIPRALGSVPFGFRNPALAFEPRQRAGTADAEFPTADWYTFDNAVAQDRTVIFFSENIGAQAFGLFLSDSLYWSNAQRTFLVGANAWTIGLGTYLCGGLPFTRFGEPIEIDEVLFPLSVLAIRNLPAGRYHIYAPYVPLGTPSKYELLIASQYLSILTPDAAEENDYCNVATPVTGVGSVNFTIDNPHDPDWFRFTTPLDGTFTATATVANPEADLDFYLARDFRPDSLVLVALKSEPGDVETVTGVLPAGDYLLLVVDFPGVPTDYTLSVSAFATPVVPGIPMIGASLEADLAKARAKAQAAGQRRPTALGPKGRLTQ